MDKKEVSDLRGFAIVLLMLAAVMVGVQVLGGTMRAKALERGLAAAEPIQLDLTGPDDLADYSDPGGRYQVRTGWDWPLLVDTKNGTVWVLIGNGPKSWRWMLLHKAEGGAP